MPAAVGVPPFEIARAAVGSISGLATLPEVNARIITMVENPRITAADIRKTIANDPALVARVLKVVNSSHFCLAARVESLERAIVLLGLTAVKNLAVAAGLGQMFKTVQLSPQFTAKDLWKHSVAVAVTARELARQVAPKRAEEAFLAGMVHDLGILAALQLWPAKVQAVCDAVSQTGQSFVQAERDALGTDHPLLGQALAEQWKFPAFCQTVAGLHHEPVLPAHLSRDDAALISLVHAADVICCRSKHGFNLTLPHASEEPLSGYDATVIQATSDKLDALMLASAPLLA